MTDCIECKHYYEEWDTNYYECKVNADDKYWEGKEECPYFEGED